MDEHQLASAMLDFEREQAILRKRPPLPCDGKLKVQKYKQPDWTQDLLHLIKDNPGIATNQLFDLVKFWPCRFYHGAANAHKALPRSGGAEGES